MLTGNDLTQTALELAVRSFKYQVDRLGNLQVLHSLRVGLAGRDSAEKAVGFLHDICEDTRLRPIDLELNFDFPYQIISAVRLLTHDKDTMSYRDYITRLRDSHNQLAIAVKLNDLKDNKGRVHELPDEAERLRLFDRWTWAELVLTQ